MGKCTPYIGVAASELSAQQYTAAKAAQATMARSLALEGAHVGIAVNAMAPAATTAAMKRNITDPKILDAIKDATPDLCAPLAVYLCHESNPFSGRVFFTTRGYCSEIVYGTEKIMHSKTGDLTLEEVAEAAVQERGPFRAFRNVIEQSNAVNE
jgi:hypothetical protein